MTAVDWRDDESGWLVRAGIASHIGNYRDRNEDRAYLDPERPFAIVLDGMGGQPAGELASSTGAEAVAGALRAGLEANEDPAALIERALRTGNEALLARSNSSATYRNCGTTVVFAFVSGGAVWIAWLGDSPAFRLSGDRIEKLTHEHNLLRAMVQAGRISESEINDFRGGHQLWKYLGTQEAPPFDAVSFAPRPGDKLLLTTDGLSNFATEDELRDGCRVHADPRRCAEELVSRALDNNSRDNCTCAVLTFEWVGDGPPPESHQETWEVEPSAPPRLIQKAPAARKWWQIWK